MTTASKSKSRTTVPVCISLDRKIEAKGRKLAKVKCRNFSSYVSDLIARDAEALAAQ